jgi:hypothetical protein
MRFEIAREVKTGCNHTRPGREAGRSTVFSSRRDSLRGVD